MDAFLGDGRNADPRNHRPEHAGTRSLDCRRTFAGGVTGPRKGACIPPCTASERQKLLASFWEEADNLSTEIRLKRRGRAEGLRRPETANGGHATGA